MFKKFIFVLCATLGLSTVAYGNSMFEGSLFESTSDTQFEESIVDSSNCVDNKIFEGDTGFAVVDHTDIPVVEETTGNNDFVTPAEDMLPVPINDFINPSIFSSGVNAASVPSYVNDLALPIRFMLRDGTPAAGYEFCIKFFKEYSFIVDENGYLNTLTKSKFTEIYNNDRRPDNGTFRLKRLPSGKIFETFHTYHIVSDKDRSQFALYEDEDCTVEINDIIIPNINSFEVIVNTQPSDIDVTLDIHIGSASTYTQRVEMNSNSNTYKFSCDYWDTYSLDDIFAGIYVHNEVSPKYESYDYDVYKHNILKVGDKQYYPISPYRDRSFVMEKSLDGSVCNIILRNNSEKVIVQVDATVKVTGDWINSGESIIFYPIFFGEEDYGRSFGPSNSYTRVLEVYDWAPKDYYFRLDRSIYDDDRPSEIEYREDTSGKIYSIVLDYTDNKDGTRQYIFDTKLTDFTYRPSARDVNKNDTTVITSVEGLLENDSIEVHRVVGRDIDKSVLLSQSNNFSHTWNNCYYFDKKKLYYPVYVADNIFSVANPVEESYYDYNTGENATRLVLPSPSKQGIVTSTLGNKYSVSQSHIINGDTIYLKYTLTLKDELEAEDETFTNFRLKLEFDSSVDSSSLGDIDFAYWTPPSLYEPFNDAAYYFRNFIQAEGYQPLSSSNEWTYSVPYTDFIEIQGGGHYGINLIGSSEGYIYYEKDKLWCADEDRGILFISDVPYREGTDLVQTILVDDLEKYMAPYDYYSSLCVNELEYNFWKGSSKFTHNVEHNSFLPGMKLLCSCGIPDVKLDIFLDDSVVTVTSDKYGHYNLEDIPLRLNKSYKVNITPSQGWRVHTKFTDIVDLDSVYIRKDMYGIVSFDNGAGKKFTNISLIDSDILDDSSYTVNYSQHSFLIPPEFKLKIVDLDGNPVEGCIVRIYDNTNMKDKIFNSLYCVSDSKGIALVSTEEYLIHDLIAKSTRFRNWGILYYEIEPPEGYKVHFNISHPYFTWYLIKGYKLELSAVTPLVYLENENPDLTPLLPETGDCGTILYHCLGVTMIILGLFLKKKRYN